MLIRNLFTEEILRIKAFVKSGAYFLLVMYNLYNPEQSFFIMSVINSMPAAWRLLIRTANIAPVLSPLPNTPAILINDILIPILDASSKHIYRSFLAKTQTTPTAKEKLSAKYHHLTIDWKRVYLLSFRTTLETKLREVQFKVLNRIVFTNEKLFRFGMAESDKCVFCQTEVESIEHSLFSCKISSFFLETRLVLAKRHQYHC